MEGQREREQARWAPRARHGVMPPHIGNHDEESRPAPLSLRLRRVGVVLPPGVLFELDEVVAADTTCTRTPASH